MGKKVTPVSFDDALQYLHPIKTIWSPIPFTWVRLRRWPYRGDIAFVTAVKPSGIPSIMFIPRLSYTASLRKRKRGKRTIPTASLFDLGRARTAEGVDCVREVSVSRQLGDDDNPHTFTFWKYKDQYYNIHGFCEVFDADPALFAPINADPSINDLLSFSTGLTNEMFEEFAAPICNQTLQAGDNVYVFHRMSDVQGMFGKVAFISSSEALLLDETNLLVHVDLQFIRRYFKVGDYVRVFAGPHTGVEGWVVATEQLNVTVSKHDDHQSEQVSQF
jgi:hypothetical protein